MSKLPSARELMAEIRTVVPTDSVRRVLQLLVEQDIAVLVDADRRPIGVLTWSDPQVRELASAAPSDVRSKRAQDIFPNRAHKKVLTVSVGRDLLGVSRALRKRSLSTGIPVVDERGRLQGFIFRRAVMECLGRFQQMARHEVDENIQAFRERFPAQWDRMRQLSDVDELL